MLHAQKYLHQLPSAALRPDERIPTVRAFARELQWTPSYEVINSFGVLGIEDHIVVEHGIENSTVLSFVKSDRVASDLTPNDLQLLLTLSYNNLIDWHYFISDKELRRVNNLTSPLYDRVENITSSNINILSGQSFTTLIEKEKIDVNLVSCDDALINIITDGKLR